MVLDGGKNETKDLKNDNQAKNIFGVFQPKILAEQRFIKR